MKIEGKVAKDDIYFEYKGTPGSVVVADPASFDRTYIWRTENGNKMVHRCNYLGANLIKILIFFLGQACTEGESCSLPNHVNVNDKNQIEPQVVTLTKVLAVGVSLIIQKENPSDMKLLL